MSKNLFSEWFTDLVTNLRFFSRLPLPKSVRQNEKWNTPNFRNSLSNLPLIGFIMTFPVIILLNILTFTNLPPLAIAALVIFFMSLISGGLHEDGLADSADGIFGGNTIENRLAIMKDSRIGSYGVIALFFSFFIRIFAFSEILVTTSNLVSSLILIAMAAISRGAMLMPWVMLFPARNDGLSTKFGIPSVWMLLEVNIFAIVLSVPLIIFTSFVNFILAYIFCIWITFIVCYIADKKIKGHTGDILGAAQQLAEIGFLIGLLLL